MTQHRHAEDFDASTYWTRRCQRYGKTYVARGGRAKEYAREFAAVAPFLRDAVQGAHAVLDFGCGSQRFRPALEAPDRTYVGVDLITANGTGDIDLTNGLLPHEQFDCAVAAFVLQHIVDPFTFKHWVRQLCGCLRPGGRLLLVNHDAPIAHPDAHMATWRLHDILEAGVWARHEQWGVYDGVHWMGTLWRA